MTPPDRAPEPLSADRILTPQVLAEIGASFADEPIEVRRILTSDRKLILVVGPFSGPLDAARDSRPVGEGLREAANLLNSLGIAGPNMRHERQTEPDPKWDADERALWELTQDQEWCVCGRSWPCEALALADLIGSLALASQRSDGLGRSERAEERQAPDRLQAGSAAVRPVERELDVERLALAMHQDMSTCLWPKAHDGTSFDVDLRAHRAVARVVAAEYRRLSTTQPASTEAEPS